MLTKKDKAQKIPNLQFPSIHGRLLLALMRSSIYLTQMHYNYFKKRDLTESQFFTLMAIYYSENKRVSNYITELDIELTKVKNERNSKIRRTNIGCLSIIVISSILVIFFSYNILSSLNFII